MLVGVAEGGLARLHKGLAREVRGLVVVTGASGEGQQATVARGQLA